MCTYVPNSAIWWALYHIYQGMYSILLESFNCLLNSLTSIASFVEKLRMVLPDDISHLFVQCVAGTFGGFTTTLITNPMDTIRARLQV